MSSERVGYIVGNYRELLKQPMEELIGSCCIQIIQILLRMSIS